MVMRDTGSKIPNVAFVRQELKTLQIEYDTVAHCLAGEVVIKSKRTKYLPQPNSSDVSNENAVRYSEYVNRAVFYNVTFRTQKGLLGQIFQKKAAVEIPLELEQIIYNITGTGLNLTQFSKIVAGDVIAFGRGGILIDYPQTENGASKYDLDSGNIRPILTYYKSENIINWRTINIGAKAYLNLVVLKEKYISYDDGFEIKEQYQYRVLTLENGIYIQRIYKNANTVSSSSTRTWNIVSESIMKGADGRPLAEIQFEFIGSEDNEPTPDYPPLYDIASVNIGHYRNSADYEESCYICGQVTPYYSGLTEHWVKEVLKGTVQLGSRAAVPLPVGATAGLLQASPNSMNFEAMAHKEKQMSALGAKLVEPRKVAQTATEDSNDEKTEVSILSTIADNISIAIENSLKKCCNFIGIESDGIVFKLNTNYGISYMTSGERAELIKEWQSGAISFTEMRTLLKDANIAYQDDEEVIAEMEQKKLEQEEAAAEAAENLNQNQGVNNGAE